MIHRSRRLLSNLSHKGPSYHIYYQDYANSLTNKFNITRLAVRLEEVR